MAHDSSLNRHLNKVHPNQNGQKKEYLKCEFCPRDFLCGSALQTHNRIHQKENIATCEFCGFAYGTIHDLNRHINKVHPEKKSQLKKNNLKCEFCLRDFLRGSELQRHILGNNSYIHVYDFPQKDHFYYYTQIHKIRK